MILDSREHVQLCGSAYVAAVGAYRLCVHN